MTAKRCALYLRVSTDGQTTLNQRRELEAVAERAGWQIVEVYEDAGVSGAKGREQRDREHPEQQREAERVGAGGRRLTGQRAV